MPPNPRPVPVGEPPTPEGWPRMIYVCSTCGRIREQPWRCEHPLPVSADGVRPAVYRWTEPTEVRVAPVGGAGPEEEIERLRGVLAIIRSAPEHAVEYVEAALSVPSPAAGVGGTGVRLTEEEMKALLGPRGDWDQALGSAKKKLLAHLAASVGEGAEDG